jgi:amino acid permease
MRDASRVVPTSMAGSAILNGLLGLAAVLTFAFSLPSPTTSLSSPTSAPPSPAATFIVAFHAATRSRALTTAATAILLTLLFGAALSALATASRHAVRLARDDALPPAALWAASWRAAGTEAPAAALLLALAGTAALALLHLAVDGAFQLGAALFVAALLFTYFVGIACALLHRMRRGGGSEGSGGSRRGRVADGRAWSLGALSVPASVFALAYLALVFVFSFFPLSRSGLTPATMNWSALVFGAAALLAGAVYALHGRYVFKGPAGMFCLPFEDPASYRPASYLPTYDE